MIRVSLGLASSFQDVWKVLKFAAMIGNEKTRKNMETARNGRLGTMVGSTVSQGMASSANLALAMSHYPPKIA